MMIQTVLSLVLLSYVLTSAGHSPMFYGNKCSSDPNIEIRENLADLVFSGRVKAIHSTTAANGTYSCKLHVYRVIKGEDKLTEFLGLSPRSVYARNLEVYGFGNRSICDSDVTHGDVRVVMAVFGESQLELSSSLIRVRPQTLRRKSYSQSGTSQSHI